MIEPRDEAALTDADVQGADGVRLGSVTEIYRDDVSQRPEWVAVDLGGNRRFMPLREAELVEGVVRVPYDADLVAAAPAYDPDAGQLRGPDEALLYDHYGLPHALPYPQGPGSDVVTGGEEEEPTVSEGPLAPQSARAWDDEQDVGEYAGEPAREGHLPASDALRPGQTHNGSTARDEIQEVVDVEMSGERLTDEQRAVRTHGEEHVVAMESDHEGTEAAVGQDASGNGTGANVSDAGSFDPDRHPVPHEQGGIPAAGTGADGSRMGNASLQSSAGTGSLQDRYDDDAPVGEKFIVTDAGEHLPLGETGGPA